MSCLLPLISYTTLATYKTDILMQVIRMTLKVAQNLQAYQEALLL